MTGTFITRNVPDGCVGWADGHPPRLAHGETRDAVLAALRDAPSGGQTPDQPVDPPLKLSLILSPGRPLASLTDVLKHAALAERSDILFSIAGAEPLNGWPAAQSWITGCVDHLSRTESTLRTRFQIETRLPRLPEGFSEFLCRYAGWCSVSVLDSAEDAAQSRQRQDLAAQLADLGIRVAATVALRPRTRDHWMELAQEWQMIVRGDNLTFAAPSGKLLGASRGAGESSDPAEVAAFLSEICDDRRFDLWSTDPFATLLRALCSGLDTIPRCGTPHVAGLSGEQLVIGCQSGSLECARTRRRPCTCEFGPFCDVIEPMCPAEAAATGNSECSVCDRLFCRAVQTLVPRFLEELAVGARYQQFLQDRQANERIRIGARSGKLKIWTDRVVSDHRNRFGEKNGAKHDLGGTQPAGTAGWADRPTGT